MGLFNGKILNFQGEFPECVVFSTRHKSIFKCFSFVPGNIFMVAFREKINILSRIVLIP